MYTASLKDQQGNISATVARTKTEVDKWLYDHGIKKIKWNDGKITKITK
jgi:hypothetical protein